MNEETFWLSQLNQYKNLKYEPSKKYESWQPARWAANKAMLQRIFAKIKPNIKSALELGAGSAALSLELARTYNINSSCIDLCVNAKKYASIIANDMQININYDVGDFFKTNLPKADFVFSLGVIEHMDKTEQVKYVQRCKELTNKYILIGIPNQESDIFKSYIKWCNKQADSYNENHLEFSLNYLKKLIECEGFKILDEDGFQVFLSEGRFWMDSKLICEPLINEMRLYNKSIAENFPNYNFQYEDIEFMKLVESNISKEYRIKNSFMQYILAEKEETLNLKKNDTVAVFAPSRSMKIISEDCQKIAKERLNKLGLNVVYSKNIYDTREYYDCGTIEHRVEDLHNIFLEDEIKGALTVIGGFNVNQILPFINYDIIKNNPKILCGFSDITALFNAIYAKTGVMTFYGPHFSSFGMKHGCEYTIDNFKNMIFNDNVIKLKSSKKYSDDFWFIDQDQRKFIENEGMFSINNGIAEGILIGGNLSTFNLLQGTEYMPSLKDKILFIEDDDITGGDFFREFDRNLVSLIQLPDFKFIKGIIIGRAQNKTEMNRDKWRALFDKRELKHIPIIADVNFGHTTPIATIPIGGYCKMVSENKACDIYISKHKF